MPEIQTRQSSWFRKPLLSWLFRPMRWLSISFAALAALYIMTSRSILAFDMLGWVPYFILAHCVALVWVVGRVERASFGYLYVQGHDRDTLWRHTMMASTLSVMVVWLPCTLLIWFGIRSGYQPQLPLSYQIEYLHHF